MTKEEAIYRLNNTAWLGSDADRVATEEAFQMAIEALQVQKTGKWETAYLDHVSIGCRPKVLYCSKCHQCIAYPTNYCPNCGTQMEGE